jgi:hypothetical protein
MIRQSIMPTSFTPQSNDRDTETPNTLAPLSTIRTETVFSRLPIHNLAKKGKVNIQILRKNNRGEVDLRWEVSYNDRFGQPRQLAYKLDTIIINRKIDELARPLPRMICLGSLHTIAEELALKRDTLSVKKAILQNAASFITAKLRYTGIDGIERTIEAGFTRYSVVFTGERLPDGTKADAVYLVLNDPYWEVLNNAPTRPLDYEYLKALAPAAQRFYEIISFKIFAALKYRHPTAKISYSEYCTFSAQQRYRDYDHVKKQMYKVHRPHLKSGYLKKVECDAARDSDGNPDWMMYYTPGPKALAEFKMFNKNHLLSDKAVDVTIDTGTSAPLPAPIDTSDAQARELVTEFYHRFHNVQNPIPQHKEIAQASRLISTHGMEKARHIVNYSHQIAPGTKYEPQIFGGILQYEGRAIADYNKRQRNRQMTTATERCTFCDQAGMVSMKDAKGAYVATKCSHDIARMKAYAQSKGYEIEVRNRARDVSYEA